MKIRVDTQPGRATVTFTTSTGVVITAPAELDLDHQNGARRSLQVDVPDLESVSIVGEIASITGGS